METTTTTTTTTLVYAPQKQPFIHPLLKLYCIGNVSFGPHFWFVWFMFYLFGVPIHWPLLTSQASLHVNCSCFLSSSRGSASDVGVESHWLHARPSWSHHHQIGGWMVVGDPDLINIIGTTHDSITCGSKTSVHIPIPFSDGFRHDYPTRLN